MAKNGNGGRRELPVWQRWVAGGLFSTGLSLLLLVAFGPLVWGDKFDAETLRVPALGLLVVGVYVLLGVVLPALNWGGLVTRVLLALLKDSAKNGNADGNGDGNGNGTH